MLKLFEIEKCTNGKKCMFHSLIPLKNVQIFKGNVKCKTFVTLNLKGRGYYTNEKDGGGALWSRIG